MFRLALQRVAHRAVTSLPRVSAASRNGLKRKWRYHTINDLQFIYDISRL